MNRTARILTANRRRLPDTMYGGEQSDFAGLPFLIPILDRLGIREFVELNPALADCGFANRFLLYVGGRIGMPETDPLAALLLDETDGPPEPLTFRSTPALEQFAAEARPYANVNTARGVWLTAIRRWCRRNARMGLITLIRRRGLVAASRTHLDVSFSLDQADVRLRRLALDVDPGWVPWLGRIVNFHYGNPDRDR